MQRHSAPGGRHGLRSDREQDYGQDHEHDSEYRRPASSDYPEPFVAVAAGGSRGTSVLEVRAHDAPGLLYRVARAVASAQATIQGAKVSTLGSDAVDVFFVTDVGGGVLTTERMDALRATVLSSLT